MKTNIIKMNLWKRVLENKLIGIYFRNMILKQQIIKKSLPTKEIKQLYILALDVASRM